MPFLFLDFWLVWYNISLGGQKMQTILLEIRAGEGGMDSKLFMTDMAKMYASYCVRFGAAMECL
jgi:protein subunit release factor A